MNEHRSLTTVNQQIITGMEKYTSAISQCLIYLHSPGRLRYSLHQSTCHLLCLIMETRMFNFVYFFPTCTNHGIHDFTFETLLICFVNLFDLYKVLFNGILPEFSILRSRFADAFKRCDVFEMHIFLLEQFICF